MKYRRYASYKPIGVDETEEIPSHWQIKKLKYMASLQTEKVNASQSDYRYIGLENVSSGTARLIEDSTPLKSEGTATLYKKGDVLFGKLRPYLAKVWEANNDGICSSEFLVLRPREATSSFLKYQLLSDRFIQLVDSSTYGAKMPRASWDFIGHCYLMAPPEVEQALLGSFLDYETAEIDALIAKQEELITRLQEKRQALISHAVTKGTNSSVPMYQSGIEWVGEIPAHWSRTALKHLVNKKITDGPHETPDFLDEGIPFLSAEAVKNNKLDFSKKRGYISKDVFERYALKCLPQRDDVFMVKSGNTTGAIAIVETNELFGIWSPLAVIRAKQDIVHPRFVFYAMNSTEFQTGVRLFASYGTQPNIGMGVIENLFITVPPLEEQLQIVHYLDNEVPKIGTLIETAEIVIRILQERRSALITAAVTGQIDVRGIRKTPDEPKTS